MPNGSFWPSYCRRAASSVNDLTGSSQPGRHNLRLANSGPFVDVRLIGARMPDAGLRGCEEYSMPRRHGLYRKSVQCYLVAPRFGGHDDGEDLSFPDRQPGGICS